MSEVWGTHHRAEELAASLPPLQVAAERVAATVAQGVHGRRRVGQGETFWQFRRYEPGDSVSQIDWRQSAKSQPVYVRESEWEAAESVWLWRDGSDSMVYRSTPDVQTKRERAELLVLALASLLLRAGERVSLLGSGQFPASGRRVMMRLTEALGREHAEAPEARKSLPPREHLPRFSRAVLIGDFLEPLKDVQKAVAGLAGQGVRGHMLQIVDPAEESLPFKGRIRFRDVEGGSTHLIGKVETVREDYQEILKRHRAGLHAIAQSYGWSLTHHQTDHPPERALMALYLALSQSGRSNAPAVPVGGGSGGSKGGGS